MIYRKTFTIKFQKKRALIYKKYSINLESQHENALQYTQYRHLHTHIPNHFTLLFIFITIGIAVKMIV